MLKTKRLFLQYFFEFKVPLIIRRTVNLCFIRKAVCYQLNDVCISYTRIHQISPCTHKKAHMKAMTTVSQLPSA